MAVHHRCESTLLMRNDALRAASLLPDGIVQAIVTSPPYFGLRDYGHEHQLGAEKTVDEYVGNLVALFRELRRVLADDGTLWLNLGDSYARDPGKGGSGTPNGSNVAQMGYGGGNLSGLPEKNLVGVPWRVAFALQADGWILRSDVIWAKPNPMPESVRDRPTKAHEYLFMLTKSPRYHYDIDAVREPFMAESIARTRRARTGYEAPGQTAQKRKETSANPLGRNRRTVWTVAPRPFKEAHFAVYPPELIRPCILASSRPGGIVLDPFSGSGTTGMVALQEGRRYLGIDVSEEYLDLSRRTRLAGCC